MASHSDTTGIIDTDSRFVIDIVTGKIENHSDKESLRQYSHNSERFSFEMPRHVEGHDMTNCTKVTVNYLAADIPGEYEVDDLAVDSEDDDKITFSWLISSNVTQKKGKLRFAVVFECAKEDGTITYRWPTDINYDYEIKETISNDSGIVYENVDILEQWKQQLFYGSNSVTANIQAEGRRQQALVANKGSEVKKSIPDDYATLSDRVSELCDHMDLNIVSYTFSWNGSKKVSTTDGKLFDPGIYAASSLKPCYSNFVTIGDGIDHLEIHRSVNDNKVTGGAFYSAASESYFISGFKEDSGNNISVPDGAKYFRINSTTDGSSNLALVVNGIPEETAVEVLKKSVEDTKANAEATNEEIRGLKKEINVISDERNFIPIKISFSDNVGKYITDTGVIGTNKFFGISNLIPIELGNKKMRITFKKANPYIARVAFLKKNVLSNDNVIDFFVNRDSGTFDIEIPEGAKYVAVNSDTDDRGLTENGYPRVRFFPSLVDVDELAESVNGLDAKVGEISEKLVDSDVETAIEPIYEKYLGKYVTPQGTIASNDYYDASNPIRIDEMVDRIKVEVDAGNKYVSRIVFLSSGSLTISNIIWYSTDTAKPVAEYEVPNDAKYFCVAKDVDESGRTHGDYPHVITVATKKSEISDLRDKIADVEKSNRKPALNIGSKIYAVVGDTLQIFKKSIVDSLEMPYILKIESGKGRVYPRYWEYIPTSSDVGNSEIKFFLIDTDGSVIEEKTVSIITVIPQNTVKNVLNIGDSTMANGEIPIEVSRRIKGTIGVATTPTALALSNINVVGRIKNGDKTVGWEGTGGWTYTNYTSQGSRAVRFQVANAQSITVKDLIRIGATNSYGYYQFEVTEVNVTNGTGNIRAVFSYTTPYSSSFLNEVSASGNLTNVNNSVVGSYLSFTEEFYQPFWNSTANQFDIKTYVNDYCGNKVDYIFILLGINSLYDTKPFTSVDSVLDSCKNLLRKIHADLPNTKILLSTNNLVSQNGGLGFNYNAQTYFGQYDVEVINHLIFAMNKAYYTLETDTEFMQYVEVVNTHAQFDADNAFPTTIKNVNMRSGETESIGTNGVHPANNGYWQIADAEFRALLAN